MFTDEALDDTLLIQRNNFNVARINQQVGQRSTIGGTFVGREGMGEGAANSNRVLAFDSKIGIGKKAQIVGFFARSSTVDTVNSEGNSFKIQSQYQWNGLDLNLAYTQVDEGFDPQVGFLFRRAFRKPEFLIWKQVRMNGKFGLLELRPHVSYRGYWNFSGFQETGFLHVDNHWVWKQGFEVHTGINFTTEGVVTPFEISENIMVPDETFNNREAQILVITNPSKKVYISTRHVMGGFFSGARSAHSGTAGFRMGDRFNSEVTFNHNDIHLEEGNFTTDVWGARLAYAFRPRINLQSFLQYNSQADLWSANIRFNVLEQANTGLFVVYNEIWREGNVSNRSLTVKYTHIINVLK
jgi:hypothetical protein